MLTLAVLLLAEAAPLSVVSTAFVEVSFFFLFLSGFCQPRSPVPVMSVPSEWNRDTPWVFSFVAYCRAATRGYG